MILQKAIKTVAAIAAVAAAVAVCIVALAYTLYALAEPYLGKAGGAAVVAGAAALIAVVAALVLTHKAAPAKVNGVKEDDIPLTARLIELAREKPIVAAGAAVGVAFVLLKNPKVVTTLLGALVAGRAARPAKPAPRKGR